MFWFTIALLIFIFQIATILILEFRRPAKSVAWILILFVLPVIGFVMYYFLAKEYRNRHKIRKRGIPPEEVRLTALRRSKLIHRPSDMTNRDYLHQERLFHLLHHFTDSPITGCNKAEVLTDGQATFDAIIAAIEKAEHHVHMEYYTIRHDEIGCRFKELLIRKAKQGIKVRLIYDGVGSYELSSEYIRELEQAGVETECFLTPRIAFFDKRINYRNHRKIAIIDGTVGFIGGINIGDEYLGKNPKLGYWRDTHVRLEGDSVYYLQEVFLKDWWFTAREKLSDPEYLPLHHCSSDEQVQIVSSGPNSGLEEILECVFAALAAAKKRIYIATPYFIPDESLLMALRTAALSGVDVRIIIPGVSDSKLVLAASLSYVEELMAAGVRVYRYGKGFMHAKVLLVDHLLASVGTANMDQRSFYSNFEINALLFDPKPMKKIEEDFIEDLANSHELSLYEIRSRPLRSRFGQVVARMLSPLL
ncbi:cardiolipin synthase [Paenibacillus tarimensis]|uniref:cardiolipin synthase n=1 Tax=Paenibacillus tarimensis TaxID=416012 RepID=UPI001F238CCA|nr:cardiolipin synthase [Paenibacillus tarimensis]MCF2945987.1 cardiolipin synthase [Paenibacillus tarimensis]